MYDQAAKLRASIQRKSLARTVAIASGKGGVGKSNVALNFSLALGKLGKSVLLIDLDLGMGNIEILLGTSAKRSFVEMIENRLRIEEIAEAGPDGLHFIAAGAAMDEFFRMDRAGVAHFQQEFERAQRLYDFVILDMGAGLTEESAGFILAADESIIITTTEPTSMMDAYALIKHIKNRNADLPMYLLVNRAMDKREGRDTAARMKEVVQTFLQAEIVLLGILPEDKQIPKSVKMQEPFINQKESKAGAIIKQLAANYLKPKEETTAKVRTSFIGRLKDIWMGGGGANGKNTRFGR
ncbi:flagellar biosynthesis protein FlhG [Terribacillus halophilus]|uniref:Flagellar biosynthesis protein FlhG n=1 Tax=Terribacillus halophilus TaxID=361279 RepID=A0A1G6N580_9BACI|nr:MinD/ParA family protein [Terribacillus halophilus]SDC62577.1 flagellar biosynthesis protein FlhG [Terribacillus halophilus]